MKFLCSFLLLFSFTVVSSQIQTIGDFTSVQPGVQTPDLILPASHTFQYIIEEGDPITAGGIMPDNTDFTGYVPIAGSSTNGYLSINAELDPVGGVTVLDIAFDSVQQRWNVTYSERVDFSGVVGTVRNCSGAVTDWGTIISCEEKVVTSDLNNDGYNDAGWAVEIDPATKQVINKRWAMGNFKHENAAIHPNGRTVYQGVDDGTGYIYKFVADTAQNLGSGSLYVYSGSKSGSGNWIQINNTTVAERNSTLAQSAAVGGTVFNGVEDVEVGADGKIYAAVKNECRVYRFDDSDPITGTAVTNFETYVGDMSYPIDYGSGVVSEPFACGADNLAFDGDGNLWVLQDKVQNGDNNYIWVVGPAHNQANPDVRIFARTPEGCEPTGITFSPDDRFMFISMMHPDAANSITSQPDAFGNPRTFDRDVALVIALNKDLGSGCPPAGTVCDDGDSTTINDLEDGNCVCTGTSTGSETLCTSISSGNDDAEENGGDGTMYINSSDLELVNDGATGSGNQLVGMRFNQISIPKGATIQNAYLQFTVDETDAIATALTISGEDENSAAPFTISNNNISGRTPTTAMVNWNPPAWNTVGERGPDQRTPDLSSIIQEILDRPGFVPGNSMALIITGNGVRTAESYEGSAAAAAELCIQFEMAGSCDMTFPVASTSMVTNSTVSLEWTPVDGAVGYIIYGGISGGSIISLNQPATPTDLTVTGLLPNTSYVWAVQAVCSDPNGTVAGPLSNIETFTTLPTCNAPASNFTDMITNSTARLNWTPVIGATGYQIAGNSLSIVNDLAIAVPGGATSFFDVITLPAATSFRWRVQAICPDGSLSQPTERDTFTTNVLKSTTVEADDFSPNLSSITVFPNPVSSKLLISVDKIPSDESFQTIIYDFNGREVYRKNHIAANGLLEVTIDKRFTPGIYQLKVSSSGSVEVRKVCIQ